MKIKKKHISVFAMVALTGLLLPLKVEYKVYSTGRIFPEKEWVLGRTEDGRITSTIRDNHLGVINSYGAREFQRGDIIDFYLNPDIAAKKFISKGEVVGSLYSNDMKRLLAELEGSLKVEKALLGVYSTGEKTEIVKESQTALNLAGEQYEIKKKLFERKKQLFEDSLLSPQEYDIAMNEFETTRINYELAQARLQTVTSGQKPEQLKFSAQRIHSLENQIRTVKERLESLEIKAPFAGLILRRKTTGNSMIKSQSPYMDMLANVADTSSYIIITPIQLKEAKYVATGQKMKIHLYNSEKELEAEISHIDNVIQIVNGKQAIFVTAVLTHKNEDLLPGVIGQTSILTGQVTAYDYVQRMFGGLFLR